MVKAPPVAAYRRVMLTADMSEGGRNAVKTCAALDIARGARASILHVLDAPAIHLAISHALPSDERQAYLDDQRKEASQALSALVGSVEWRSFRQDLRQVRSPPAEDILAAAREESGDLLVVGAHGRSGLARFFLGSVAEAVLCRADREVMAIPPAASP
ncbi:Nucleotide-binding universal stress protein, UspA family [Paracoccus halophilus]|uniref:Nucleotide-binding universal stress protein, UspA family n=1 Tax=Paracoccus halophilus TaxID=376733 RepID=A0A1I0TEL8_9RHOB|nr:universal stress protein [Paracoccus halophilus]SFA50238.1 Nucleotide-binding universal stress protein, UspA family [Paracoccus halophilus]